MQEEQQAQTEEFATPQEEQSTQVSEALQEENQEQTQKNVSDEQERNWKALRTKAEEAERRSQEYEKKLNEMEGYLKALSAKDSSKEAPKEEEIDFSDDDIPTYGDTKKAIRKEAEKIAKNIVNETLQKREYEKAPIRLKKEFSDFDDVVSKDNVNYLIKNEPELAETLRNTKDPYKQGKIAYKFLKSMNKGQKGEAETLKQDAEANSKKPVSPNAVKGRNSLNDANSFKKRLTPDLKKQLYQEMVEASRRG